MSLAGIPLFCGAVKYAFSPRIACFWPSASSVCVNIGTEVTSWVLIILKWHLALIRSSSPRAPGTPSGEGELSPTLQLPAGDWSGLKGSSGPCCGGVERWVRVLSLCLWGNPVLEPCSDDVLPCLFLDSCLNHPHLFRVGRGVPMNPRCQD